MVRKVSRRTCREVLRCQLTRCTLPTRQTRPGPVSSRLAYPQRMLVAGSARARTPGARILEAVPPAGIVPLAWMTGIRGTGIRGTGTRLAVYPPAGICILVWMTGIRTRAPRPRGRCSLRAAGGMG